MSNAQSDIPVQLKVEPISLPETFSPVPHAQTDQWRQAIASGGVLSDELRPSGTPDVIAIQSAPALNQEFSWTRDFNFKPSEIDKEKNELASLAFTGLKKGILRSGISIALDFLGISDTLRCIDCVRKGDWFGAALSGAFAVWSLVGIFTGGAACIAKMGLKEGAEQATKQGTKALVKLGTEALEKVAQQEGKNILAKIAVEKAGAQIVEKVGVEAALKIGLKEGAEKLASASISRIDKILSFCPGFVRNIFGEKIVARVVENKAEKFAFELVKQPTRQIVSEMLERVSKLGITELATNYGLVETEAKALKWLLADTSKDWISKRILRKAIVAEITEPLKRAITSSFMEKFSSESVELCAKYGLAHGKVIAAAERGLSKGLEKGISRGVKEGIDEAFKDRKRRWNWTFGAFNSEQGEIRRRADPSHRMEDPLIFDSSEVAHSELGSRKGASRVGRRTVLVHKNQDGENALTSEIEEMGE